MDMFPSFKISHNKTLELILLACAGEDKQMCSILCSLCSIHNKLWPGLKEELDHLDIPLTRRALHHSEILELTENFKSTICTTRKVALKARIWGVLRLRLWGNCIPRYWSAGLHLHRILASATTLLVVLEAKELLGLCSDWQQESAWAQDLTKMKPYVPSYYTLTS